MGHRFAAQQGADPAEFAAGLDDARRLVERLTKDLRAGTTQPRWWWTAYDDARSVPVARQHWWGPPGQGKPIVVVQAQVVDVDAAAALLAHARDVMELPDAWSELTLEGDDDRDPWTAYPDRVAVLERAGFSFQIDRVRVEWLRGTPLPEPPTRLALRPASQLAETQLVELFAAVADGSLDHSMQEERLYGGREAEAARRLKFVRAYPGVGDRFAVGVDGTGTVVGYVAPAVDARLGIVAEIGVAEPFRGNGYVHELLASAVHELADAGADRIIADTDCPNKPMRAAFIRAGFREFARRWDWGWRREPAL